MSFELVGQIIPAYPFCFTERYLRPMRACIHKVSKTMKDAEFVLGIDISKRHFDVALLLPNGKRKNKRFNNSSEGHEALGEWLTGFDVTSLHACLEATNTYGNALAEHLHDAGYQVSMVNPARIKGFANSELLRTKTDKQDASLIARFCQAMRPTLWEPEPLKVRELKALVRRLDSLIEMQQQETNRLDVAEAVVKPEISSHIKGLEQRIQQVRNQISDHIDDDPGLREQRDLLLSIPGIGEKTVATLLSYFASIERFDTAKKMAAFCGVTPHTCQSGSSIHRRGSLSKIGPVQLRKALFFPAMVAVRYNPAIKALSKRLTAAGKPKMLIIGAAMRKLVHIIFGVLKHQRPFKFDESGVAA